MVEQLVIRGAREHNLRNISLDLPRERLIVFTGLSGSGKSSLAFDTIYAEGQRRYVESLSAYARQFLGQMDKPDVDFIEGLSPAISIDQKSASPQPALDRRHDHRGLRLPAPALRPHRRAALPARRHGHHPADAPADRRPGAHAARGHPLPGARAGRARPQGQLREPPVRPRHPGLRPGPHRRRDARPHRQGRPRPLRAAHDRGRDRPAGQPGGHRAAAHRLARDRAAAGRRRGRGAAGPRDGEESEEEKLTFSQHLACPTCGRSYDELAPRNFSFNSPYGACEHCDGLGTRFEVDPELVVANPALSIAQGAIQPWAGGHAQYFHRLLEAVCEEHKIPGDKPWGKLTAKQRNVILHGKGVGRVHVKYKNRYGRVRSYHAQYEGVVPWIQRRHQDTESEGQREQFEGYMREVPCPECGGARLKPFSLGVTIAGHTIADLCAMSIGDAAAAIGALELSERDRLIAERVQKEVDARLGFLLDVGLDYLSLGRSAATLAGGEAQRIRLASQIGSGLVGVLYVLDEPSIGLHQRDNKRLIETLLRLRDLGNTVLVVEHDEETIKVADYVVDIGPARGSTAAAWSTRARSSSS